MVDRSQPAGWLAVIGFQPSSSDEPEADEEGHIAFHRLDVPPELAYEAWIGASTCPQRAITVIGEPEAVWKARRDEART